MAGLIDYSKFSEKPQNQKRKAGPILFILLILTVASFWIFKHFNKKKEIVNKPTRQIIKEVVDKSSSFFKTDTNSKSLENIVQNQLKNSNGNYGIVIKNLKTGERYYFNEHKTFEAASLYKLFIMATVFQNIQDGTLNINDILAQEIKILNEKFRISSESAELTEGKITLPVQTALQRMITISDNYSALLLTEKIRLSKVSIFLEQNAFNESKVGTKGEEPTTTASDMALFFEKLYKEELADKLYTDEMLTLLKSQRLNSKIPKYLPKDIIVAHKTGELGKISHDVGIVYTPRADYVLVILTETTSKPIADEKISKISKAVYDYFTK